ncbi:GTPase activating rab protein [Mycena indigotica]|uniref:GTPase activating rab protein n=1 Tax=Mycena indigotica TaxID=2126181 RepID=A0A8H6SQA6_9AGAR|nr:GTPase activating rab protein [Mycena indigotica]KAF7303469.1 GTPase activating rab protein [Mycena indigotica]
MGEWVGTWWTKSRPRSVSKPAIPPPLESPPKSNSSVETDDSTVGATAVPRAPTANPINGNRRRTVRSVFGTLSLSMGSSSRQSVVLSDNASIHSTALGANPPASMVSPPFSPVIAAAPHLTTILDSSDDAPSTPLIQGSAIRAVVNATRVMTAEPSSNLVDGGQDTEPLIARLALELVRNARDEGLVWRDPTKERRDRERRAATEVDTSADGPIAVLSPPLTSPAEAIQSGAGQCGNCEPGGVSGQDKREWQMAAAIMANAANPAPLFAGLMSAQTQSATSAATEQAPEGHLQYRSNQSSRKWQNHPHNIFPGHTLRLQHAIFASRSQFRLLLLHVRCPFAHTSERVWLCAPACFTGVKIADRVEDDDDEMEDGRGIEIVRTECDCGGEDNGSLNSNSPDNMSVKSKTSAKSKRLSIVSATATTPVPQPSFAILAVTADSPRHPCAATVRRLLDALTTLHDERQTLQRRE